MGVLGEIFPSRKLLSEAGEAGDGQGWRLGPIDLDAGVVEVHRVDGVHQVDRVHQVDGVHQVDATSGPDAATGPDAPVPPHPRTPPSP